MSETDCSQNIQGYCALCTSSCGCISVVKNGRLLKVEPDPSHPTGQAMCGKGRAAAELVHHNERLLYPLRRISPKNAEPKWERISWDEALDKTVEALRRLADDSGPESVAFGITTPSGTGLQDSYPWIERLRYAFGSPNAVFGTEICNFHRDNIYAYTFGVDTPMPDFAQTDCLILWGHNPSSTWLSFASRVAEAKARGAKLIVIDPRRAGLAVKADEWLRVRPGSDGALALGLANLLIEEQHFDAAFVREWTNGPFLVGEDGMMLRGCDIVANADPTLRVAWDIEVEKPVFYDPESGTYEGAWSALALTGCYEIMGANDTIIVCKPAFELYAESCRAFTPEHVEAITWIPADQLRATAHLIFESNAVSSFSWSGVGQHSNASQTSRAIALLYALTGSFDSPGGNVLFNTIPVEDISGAELLAPEQLAKALGATDRPMGPAESGWITTDDLYRAILDSTPYQIKGMINFGSNILVSHANTARGISALNALEFAVHIDMFMTPSAALADIVLPVNTPWEREGLKTNFKVGADAASYIQLRPQVIESLGESKSDIWIAFELAKRLGLAEHFWDGDIDVSYRALLAPSGISLEELRRMPGGIKVPSKTRYRKYANNVSSPLGFATPSRKVEIFSERLQAAGQAALPYYVEPAIGPNSRPDLYFDFPLVLTSSKSIHYCHSQHRGLPSLRKREPDPLVEMHPDAATARQILDGDWIDLVTPDGSIRARARLRDTLDPRVVSATYGWWQPCTELGLSGYDIIGPASANINYAIGNQQADPISGSVAHRSYLCEISLASEI